MFNEKTHSPSEGVRFPVSSSGQERLRVHGRYSRVRQGRLRQYDPSSGWSSPRKAEKNRNRVLNVFGGKLVQNFGEQDSDSIYLRPQRSIEDRNTTKPITSLIKIHIQELRSRENTRTNSLHESGIVQDTTSTSNLQLGLVEFTYEKIRPSS